MMNGYGTKTVYAKNDDLLKVNIKPSFNKTFAVKNTLVNRLHNARGSDGFAKLMLKMPKVSFNSGETVFQPNGRHDYVYFPETAVFSQMNILEDGRTIETAMIGSEGIIGMSAILGLQSTNLWTQVSLAGTAYRVATEVFKKEFVQGGFLQIFFLEYVNYFIRQISQRAVCNNHHRINERFSTWLLMLDDRVSLEEKNKLSLTQEQIAQFLGAHRPTVTRIAQDLRDNGTIDYLRGRILILDREKLQKSACECYSAIN